MQSDQGQGHAILISLVRASDTIVAGQVIGGYTILSRLGAGGMGEVYRARDPKLGREVAIKILPRLFTADPDRLSRFDREARMLASLNHPHVGAIYGLEDMDGKPVLVLELVEGDTLAERIAEGPIAPAEALTVASQIAEALEAAHDKSIVHRDLKPANIKITPEGLVKVLDFGLAKASAGSEPGADLAKSPTVTDVGGTREGTLLGTVAYMSPEQARGKVVDRRTDIWAFGCVLYEMLSGLPAFSGETLADTLTGIIGREPDWTALPAGTPSDVRRLLKRCLEKNPSRRLRDAADVRIEIDDVLHEPSTGRPAVDADPTTRASRQSWVQTISIAAIMALGAGLAAWTLKPSSAPNRLPVARLTVALPPGDTIGLIFPSVALSPDGRILAYTAGQALIARQLFVRPIDSLDVTSLAGTEGANAPFFSPDGRWIGFFADGKLKKVLATGGGLQTLCDAAAAFGGTWGTDGSIYFAPFSTSGIWQVPASGGSPQEATRLDRTQGEVSHRWPQVSADGKVVLFTAWTGPGWDEKHLEAQIGGTGGHVMLVRGASTGRYLSTGHLLYARNEKLFVVPFDLAHLSVTGPPVTLLDRPSEQAGAGEGAQFTVSDSGTLAYVRSDSRSSDRRMVWVTAGGDVQRLNSPHAAYTDPAISPDGRSVAVSIQGPTQTIWVYDLVRSTLTTLPSVGSSQSPTWTPDGVRLVYRGTRAGYRNLFWRVADGSADEERLTVTDMLQTPATVSQDGTMVFDQASPGTGKDIWMMRLDAGRAPQPVLKTRFNEGSPQLSPNGRWMAYRSDESGRYEIYARAFPRPGGKFQISTDGGSEPRWSRDGRELFYRNGDKMMAARISIGSTLTVGAPRPLFEGHYEVSDTGTGGYDVSADRRFLMIEWAAPQQPVTHINVVLNWFEDLKRTVAADTK
jgi:serine/threonine-protein kinase